MASDKDSPNGAGLDDILSGVDSILRSTLEPLMPKREELTERRSVLREEVKAIDVELVKIDRVLRLGGLIEPSTRAKGTSPTSGPPFAPKAYSPPNKKAADVFERIKAAILATDGPFQMRTVEKSTGASRNAIENAIGVMRGDSLLHFLGMQEQIGRTAPGGRKAATFEVIR